MYYLYDLKQGVIRKWQFYLLPAVISLMSFLSFYITIDSAVKFDGIDREIYLSDLLLYLWKGDKPVVMYPIGEFHFPFMWFISQIALSFIVGRYPLSELYDGHGAYVLLKGSSRYHWLQSKFFVVLIDCIIYYSIVVVIALSFSLILGYSLLPTLPTSQSSLLLVANKSIESGKLIILLLLPFLTSIALSFFQLLISLFINSTFGFLSVLSLCGASIYFDNMWVIPNCSSLNRNSLFLSGEVVTSNAIIYLSCIAIVSYVLSQLYFSKNDIIKKGKAI